MQSPSFIDCISSLPINTQRCTYNYFKFHTACLHLRHCFHLDLYMIYSWTVLAVVNLSKLQIKPLQGLLIILKLHYWLLSCSMTLMWLWICGYIHFTLSVWHSKSEKHMYRQQFKCYLLSKYQRMVCHLSSKIKEWYIIYQVKSENGLLFIE